jgi:hypothetical protein
MLASHSACPREGHLEAVYHMRAYLDINTHNSRMVFDPSHHYIDLSTFKECVRKEFYGGVKENMPPNMSEPRGKEVELRLYVDADHAGDQLIRRSRTGFFLFLNTAPMLWYSKQQATVETSVFGSEFVALKVGMEMTRGFRYKLWMMGIPIVGPAFVYGDHMSVLHNTQRPELMLMKKSNSVCYHYCREAVMMGECITGDTSPPRKTWQTCAPR